MGITGNVRTYLQAINNAVLLAFENHSDRSKHQAQVLGLPYLVYQVQPEVFDSKLHTHRRFHHSLRPASVKGRSPRARARDSLQNNQLGLAYRPGQAALCESVLLKHFAVVHSTGVQEKHLREGNSGPGPVLVDAFHTPG